MVPPPQAVMPKPNVNDANKAIDHRPNKLNFMRFLHHPHSPAAKPGKNGETYL
jgi:hypothetical protein